MRLEETSMSDASLLSKPLVFSGLRTYPSAFPCAIQPRELRCEFC